MTEKTLIRVARYGLIFIIIDIGSYSVEYYQITREYPPLQRLPSLDNIFLQLHGIDHNCSGGAHSYCSDFSVFSMMGPSGISMEGMGIKAPTFIRHGPLDLSKMI